MTSALVIVDLQNDFCHGGRLPVPDADAILPAVNRLIHAHRHVFLTQDWHPPGHVSFASSHPGHAAFSHIMLDSGPQTLWPDHCVAGTQGAAFHEALERLPQAPVVRKGTRSTVDSYSAFYENDHRTPVGLDSLLREAGIDTLVVCGLATDYCVLHTALDARRLGYDVSVIEEACRGIDVEGSLAAAWKAMAAAGIRRV